MATLQKYSDEQLRLAARLYYVDGVGQAEVAKLVKVSQSKVSRLLAAARERGIVRITVEDYSPRNDDLEAQLQRKFHLRSVAVIKRIDGTTDDEARHALGRFGAPFVSSLLTAGSVVAIGGGRTVRDVVSLLPEDGDRRLTVVQAMGTVDSNIGPVDAFEMGRVLARRYGGPFLTLNSPAFVPDRKTRDAFLALDQIGSVWRRFAQADSALIGVGTLENSVFVNRGMLSSAEHAQLTRRGAVGEICGRLFDRAGKEVDSPWRDRVISIDLESLRKVPQVICAVVGEDRAEALAAAISGGLVKTLVIDERGAAALLEFKRPPGKKK